MNDRPIALVLDNQLLFSDGISCLLEKYADFASSISFQCPRDLIEFLLNLEHRNCYVFLEYQLEGTNGLSVANEIRRISRAIKIIFVTRSQSVQVLRTIRSFMCDAILSKYSHMENLLICIQTLKNNKVYLDPRISDIINQDQTTENILLTARELETLTYFSKGFTIDKTAKEMFLSRNTIISHRRNMMKKAKCSSMSQLITLAKNMELL